MEKEWNMIKVLRHSRHDWLNKLQIIKGNLDLNRIDRAKAIIDKIVIEAQNETKLSNLPLPGFAIVIIKANWQNYFFKLDYEVLQEHPFLQLDDRVLAAWTNAFFECLNAAVAEFAENYLVLTIDPQQDGARFVFDFNGKIKKKDRIEQFLAGTKDVNLEIAVKEFSEHELAIDAFMPFKS